MTGRGVVAGAADGTAYGGGGRSWEGVCGAAETETETEINWDVCRGVV